MCPLSIYIVAHVYTHRAPSIPMECCRGSCYGDSIEVVREDGLACALRLNLIIDGKSIVRDQSKG